MTLTRGVAYHNNRFWRGASMRKRKSRLDSAPGGRMNSSTTCETHLTVGCMPTAKKVLLTNVHYTATAAHEYIPCKVLEMYRAGPPIHFAIRLYYIARFTPRIESHDPLSPLGLPREFDRAPICARCISLPACLPAYLDDSISSLKGEGGELGGRWRWGPDVVGPVP